MFPANETINSVKTFIRSCYRRIGVTDRTNAVLWGVGHGFLPDRARLVPQPTARAMSNLEADLADPWPAA